jgi:hypothetical protein
VPGAVVSFTSSIPYFPRVLSRNADSSGAFTFKGTVSTPGGSVAVPVGDYVVRSRHPQTNVQSPDFAGTFAANAVISTKDVVFTNTGQIAGTVKRADGSGITSGTVSLSGPINVSTSLLRPRPTLLSLR